MTNREIAAILFNISTILATRNGNPYRIRAYRRAALNLLRLRHSVADRVAAGRPLGLPGLGKSLTAKISTLARRDALLFYGALCDELPAQERDLIRLNVRGLGPTIAARIHHDLGNTDPASLRRAATTGRLQRVWGIGPKRAAAILDAIGGLEVRQERMEM
ncbi:MAG: helix-hairpin-helix domain-containing protein [Kouleothrix sp.]